jgi:CTP:phosphocholine cytidylyltransferase-like protein
MTNLINFLKMKYEQFIMRECDRLDIYTRKCEDKIFELDRKNDELEIANLRLLERIDELEQKLYFYEPWEES